MSQNTTWIFYLLHKLNISSMRALPHSCSSHCTMTQLHTCCVNKAHWCAIEISDKQPGSCLKSKEARRAKRKQHRMPHVKGILPFLPLVVYGSPGPSPLQGDVGIMPKCQRLPVCQVLITPEPWDMAAGSEYSTDTKPAYDEVLVTKWFHCLVSHRCCSVKPPWRGTALLEECRSWPFLWQRALCSTAAVVEFQRTNRHQFCFLYILHGPLDCIIAVKV